MPLKLHPHQCTLSVTGCPQEAWNAWSAVAPTHPSIDTLWNWNIYACKNKRKSECLQNRAGKHMVKHKACPCLRFGSVPPNRSTKCHLCCWAAPQGGSSFIDTVHPHKWELFHKYYMFTEETKTNPGHSCWRTWNEKKRPAINRRWKGFNELTSREKRGAPAETHTCTHGINISFDVTYTFRCAEPSNLWSLIQQRHSWVFHPIIMREDWEMHGWQIVTY